MSDAPTCHLLAVDNPGLDGVEPGDDDDLSDTAPGPMGAPPQPYPQSPTRRKWEQADGMQVSAPQVPHDVVLVTLHSCVSSAPMVQYL